MSASLLASLLLTHTYTLTLKISLAELCVLPTGSDAAKSLGINGVSEVLQILRPSGLNMQLVEVCVLRLLPNMATVATEEPVDISMEGVKGTQTQRTFAFIFSQFLHYCHPNM